MGLRILGRACRMREMNGILRRIDFSFGKEMLHEYAGLPSLSGISWTKINAHAFSSSAGLTAAVLYSRFTPMPRNAWNFSAYGSPIRSTVSLLEQASKSLEVPKKNVLEVKHECIVVAADSSS